MIFSRLKALKKFCFKKKFASSKSALFSSAATSLLRSLRAGLKKKVSTPCIVFALFLLKAAFACMEMKRLALLSLASFVLSRRLI